MERNEYEYFTTVGNFFKYAKQIIKDFMVKEKNTKNKVENKKVPTSNITIENQRFSDEQIELGKKFSSLVEVKQSRENFVLVIIKNKREITRAVNKTEIGVILKSLMNKNTQRILNNSNILLPQYLINLIK